MGTIKLLHIIEEGKLTEGKFGGIVVTVDQDEESPTIPPPAGPGPEPDNPPEIPTETDSPT